MKDKKMIVLIILTIGFFLLSVFSLSLLIYQNSNKEDDISVNYDDELDNDEEEEVSGFKVEIKGEVINPGVYEVTQDNIIMDQTTPNMIQRINGIFERNPLISKGI